MRRGALMLVLLVACGGGDGAGAGDARVGSPAVYQQIAASTDCADLQATFDRAAANNDRAEPGSTERAWTLGYMRAAEERRQALGC